MDNGFLSLRQGYIEVICGCMYSGKTEELIRQIKRCEYAKQNYRVFKPRVDNRYSEDDVTSHNQESIGAIVIDDVYEIYKHIEHDTQVIGIDEAQFFSDEIVEVAKKLADKGRRVIVAGLDTDWQGLPFGPMPQLLATAEMVRKQYAICMECGEPATRTQRLVANEDEVLIGSFNMYEARCRLHFDPELSRKPGKRKLTVVEQNHPET
ncbi:MAG: thymidine kinase [Pseudomonadota bacterium]